MQTSRRPSAAGAKFAHRDGHSRSLRRLAAFGLSLCLAATLALTLAGAGQPTAAPATAGSSLAATRVRDLPPPARSLIARRQDRRADTELLTAFPATVTASGGRVRLRASVRNAVRCHFYSPGRVRLLRATRRCSSSVASITIRVPRNGAGTRRRYVVYLTVVARRGARRTIRDVILQRRDAAAPGGKGGTAGETAASGVHTHSSGSQGSGPQTGSSAAGQSVGTAGSGGQDSAPLVTTQPAGENVQPGSPVTLAATASGTPAPSVQWQVSADGGTTWVDTASSFIASAADSGRQYRAVFSNAAGTVTTNPVTLTVAPLSTTNFSGYIDYAGSGQSFSSVSAAWTVPTVTCQPGETS
ncbi:MAG: hypothetical protein ABR947_13755, partial [Solirubrobacteraceae bacterium]